MSQDTFVDDFDSFIEPDTQTGPRLLEDRFDEETAFQFVIAGIGQCGNNLAASFWQTGYRRVLLINTALTDLDPLPKEIARLLIGKQGAGKNPEEARERVLAAKTKIRSALSSLYQKGNKIVLCMGLGGGTGSGGGPETVRIAKEL
ncbi:MAG: hypothetical protein LBQ54_01555, partial [Planctomycetaceae bacterium]|nr:hypothetical protein [Planctomycetaceae bacterium]